MTDRTELRIPYPEFELREADSSLFLTDLRPFLLNFAARLETRTGPITYLGLAQVLEAAITDTWKPRA